MPLSLCQLFVLKKLSWYIVGQEPEPHQIFARSRSRIKMMRLCKTAFVVDSSRHKKHDSTPVYQSFRETPIRA
jgi:hypothetical protein